MKFFRLLFAFFLVLPASARAAEIHVDIQKGSDLTGDGSRAHPFKTLTKGLSLARAGDKVAVEAGIYDLRRGERFPLVLPAGVALEGAGRRDVFLIGGVAWKPALQVTLEGPVSLPTRISGLTVQGGWFALQVVYPKGAGSWTLSLEEVVLEGAGAGLKVPALPAGSKLSLRVEHCLLEENWGVGLLVDSGGGSLDFRVTGSVLMGNGYDGILFWARSKSPSLAGRILQSTLAGNGGGGFRLLAEKGASPGLEIRNSIVWGNRGGDLPGVPVPSVRNCLLGGGPAAGKGGNLKGDPGFLEKGDYHLGAFSRAVGLGDPSAAGLPKTDLDGQPLPARGRPDAGADQRVLHTLTGDEAGLIVGRLYSMKAYTLPGATMVAFVSMGTLSTGYPTPPLTGSLKLDFLAALLPTSSARSDGGGKVLMKGVGFISTSLIGVRLFLQGVSLRVQGSKVEGGWTNVISAWPIAP